MKKTMVQCSEPARMKLKAICSHNKEFMDDGLNKIIDREYKKISLRVGFKGVEND